jgi:hypothetical protein
MELSRGHEVSLSGTEQNSSGWDRAGFATVSRVPTETKFAAVLSAVGSVWSVLPTEVHSKPLNFRCAKREERWSSRGHSHYTKRLEPFAAG